MNTLRKHISNDIKITQSIYWYSRQKLAFQIELVAIFQTTNPNGVNTIHKRNHH